MAEPTLGERLKKRREDAGMTLREVAQLADIDFGYLSQIENNKRRPRPKNLRDIEAAIALGSSRTTTGTLPAAKGAPLALRYEVPMTTSELAEFTQAVADLVMLNEAPGAQERPAATDGHEAVPEDPHL
jgi:transcriptional regulator with XRE-family HTH domain